MHPDNDKHRISKGGNVFLRRVVTRLKSIINQKFTIMFIPHSEKQVVNFQVSVLLMGFLTVLILGMIGGIFYMTTMFSSSEKQLSDKNSELVVTQGNLDAILDEVNQLIKAYDIFDNSMSNTITQLDVSPYGADNTGSGLEDRSSMDDLLDNGNSSVREIAELQRVRSALSDAVEPMGNIDTVLRAEKSVLADLPTMWPIAAGHSYVSQEFGPNMHPIQHIWYLHKGIDLAGHIGLPIVAAANGTVVKSELDTISGYGNTVTIEHKYGFRTRYAHMGSRLVKVGDVVKQGDRIGLLGNTGVSTGPHLHFEILMGSQVLDPASFLKIKNTFNRYDDD